MLSNLRFFYYVHGVRVAVGVVEVLNETKCAPNGVGYAVVFIITYASLNCA